MKKLTIASLFLGTIVLVAPSCKKEGCTDPNAENYEEKAKEDDGTCEYQAGIEAVELNGETYYKISGEINADISLMAANKYLLSGGVFINDGATINIEAGTMIYADDASATPFLAIQRGGKINATGTATSPIVFTSIKTNPAPGDWGGIIINGKAPINTGTEAEGEGNTGLYGGTDATDNSGVIQYVRVEYAGKILGTDNELNGFSFNGCGSGTTADHLQAYYGSDDGFEFFGGTVNLSYAVSTGNEDDSFDWTHGWSGTGTNWLVEQGPVGDRGIEADNNGDDNAAAPFSNPTISNVTLNGNGTSDGMKLREGTKGTFNNIIITNFEDAIEIQHDQTLDNVTNGELTISGTSATGNTLNDINYNGTAVNATAAEAANNTNVDGGATNGADASSWATGWTK